ncbi:hypothetical protein T492DRAFT_892301 [Pavlovales sp. CCMP2436]|nr:hypothetical protein T492DRAFT_892301 [Pavlovales sp. CCMP2436]
MSTRGHPTETTLRPLVVAVKDVLGGSWAASAPIGVVVSDHAAEQVVLDSICRLAVLLDRLEAAPRDVAGGSSVVSFGTPRPMGVESKSKIVEELLMHMQKGALDVRGYKAVERRLPSKMHLVKQREVLIRGDFKHVSVKDQGSHSTLPRANVQIAGISFEGAEQPQPVDVTSAEQLHKKIDVMIEGLTLVAGGLSRDADQVDKMPPQLAAYGIPSTMVLTKDHRGVEHLLLLQTIAQRQHFMHEVAWQCRDVTMFLEVHMRVDRIVTEALERDNNVTLDAAFKGVLEQVVPAVKLQVAAGAVGAAHSQLKRKLAMGAQPADGSIGTLCVPFQRLEWDVSLKRKQDEIERLKAAAQKMREDFSRARAQGPRAYDRPYYGRGGYDRGGGGGGGGELARPSPAAPGVGAMVPYGR